MHDCPKCGSAERELLSGGWWRCLGSVIVGVNRVPVGVAAGMPIYHDVPVNGPCLTTYLAHDPLMTLL